jgi:hypothetical protein
MKYTSDYLVLFQSCQVQPAPWLCRPTASPRLARGLRRQASLGPRAEGPVGLKAGGGVARAEPPAQLACVQELGQGMTRVRNGKVY